MLLRKCPIVDGLLFIVSQFLGSMVAGMLVVMYVDQSSLIGKTGAELEKLTKEMNWCGCPHGATFLQENEKSTTEFLRGAGIETMSTFFLMLAIMGTAVDKRAAKSVYGFAIGATLAMMIFATGDATGGALNPWRHYGPIIGAGLFAPTEFGHMSLIYLFPFVGALMAGFLYQLFFMPKEGGKPDKKKATENKETELLSDPTR